MMIRFIRRIPAITSWYGKYPIIYSVLYTLQVVVWDFWTINSWRGFFLYPFLRGRILDSRVRVRWQPPANQVPGVPPPPRGGSTVFTTTDFRGGILHPVKGGQINAKIRDMKMYDTVDGSEIPNNHRLDVENLVNNGINSDKLPSNWCRVSSINSINMISTMLISV